MVVCVCGEACCRRVSICNVVEISNCVYGESVCTYRWMQVLKEATESNGEGHLLPAPASIGVSSVS